MEDRIKRKKVIVCVAWITVLVLILLNVSIRSNPFDNGGCFSVTFDKLPMLLADRAVICVGNNRYEITDLDLVNQITKETMCATNTDLCRHDTNRWIEVYCGNVLIRRMQWETNHDAIIVYQAGIFHWVFPSTEGYGMAYPSRNLLSKLEAIIASNK